MTAIHALRLIAARGEQKGQYTMATNPRWKSGLRRKYRQRYKAMQAPCALCSGRLGPIHYEEPSDAKHPLSFVIDEKIPVSKWREGGYDSPAAAADDFSNTQAAHWVCNARKGSKINYSFNEGFIHIQPRQRKPITLDGDW